MAGLSGAGLDIRTQSELQERLENALRAALDEVDLREGPEQQIIAVLSEELAIAWETIQAIYAAFGEDASGVLLDRVAALTGTIRRPATRSEVVATVNLDAGTTLPAGSQAHVEGNPDAVFETTADVTNSGGSAADVSAEMQSVETGPVAAPAGKLTVIVTSVSGWNSVTNNEDAQLGRNRAEDPELRESRRAELGSGGLRSLPAILAAVSTVDGVISAVVKENTSMTADGEGRPPKSIEAIVWDGTTDAADDNEIAQAIWDSKSEGIEAHGTSSGTATDETGSDQTVGFTRTTVLRPTVVAAVVLAPNTAAGWETDAREAIAKRGKEYEPGETAYASQLTCALMDLAFVIAVPSITINGGSSRTAAYNQIVQIDSSDVTVSEA